MMTFVDFEPVMDKSANLCATASNHPIAECLCLKCDKTYCASCTLKHLDHMVAPLNNMQEYWNSVMHEKMKFATQQLQSLNEGKAEAKAMMKQMQQV